MGRGELERLWKGAPAPMNVQATEAPRSFRAKLAEVFSRGPGGISELLRVATPLILAAGGHAINLFSDRIMLAWYSADAVSAVLPAGLTCFTASCVFVGAVGYTNAFVSQYFGAKSFERVGPSVWQGIFLALLGGLFMASGWFWAGPLFRFFGHPESVFAGELSYFRLMAPGAVIMLLNIALSALWGGRGRTKVIMLVNFLICALNISLNYCLIFGKLGLPALGITGAAIGTLCAEAAGLLVYAGLFLRGSMRRVFNTWPERLFDAELFGRLVKYGLPSGIQLFLDLAAFNVFVVIMGRFDRVVQEATSIVFSLNALSFIPMLGLGQTVSILVGQAIGARDVDRATRSVRGAFFLTAAYMGAMSLLFVLWPELLLQLFVRAGDASQAEVFELTRTLLRFIAAYTLFDGVFLIYGSAIKGAGDTAFAMWINSAMAWFCYAIPCMIAYKLGASIWILWSILLCYVVAESGVFYWRYKSGPWKRMSVIGRGKERPPTDNSVLPPPGGDIE